MNDEAHLNSLAPVFSGERLSRPKEELPVTVAGTTLVVSPGFVQRLTQVPFHRSRDLRTVLSRIARNESKLKELDDLIDEDSRSEQPSLLSQTLSASANADRFFRQVIFNITGDRSLNTRTLSQLHILEDKPYLVLSVIKERSGGVIETILASERILKDGIPKYDGGSLSGMGPHGGLSILETEKHITMGSLELRIAAIMDYAQQRASVEFRSNPLGMQLGFSKDHEFPAGRLYVILPKA